MATRKIIFYQKQATKPIILTDESNQTTEELQNQILEIFKSDKVIIFETSNDSLITRPSEIQSVLITKNNENSEIDNTTEKVKKNQSVYKESLTLEKK